jgi:hypothetical protein
MSKQSSSSSRRRRRRRRRRRSSSSSGRQPVKHLMQTMALQAVRRRA